MLVAFRLWACRWQDTRPTIHVKSDSVSALIMILDLRTKGSATGVIAREIALDVAQSTYQPNIVEHIGGNTNVVADALSRQYSPERVPIPACLDTITEESLFLNSSLFRTLATEATM